MTSTVGRLAFPVPGLYVLSAWGRFNLNVNGGYRVLQFFLNNATEEIGRQEVLASTVSLTYVSITAVLNTAGPRKFSGTGTIGPYANVELWAYTSVAPADLLSVEFSIALLGRM